MNSEQVHTIRNTVKVALEEFNDDDQIKFITFMLRRFGDNYQVESYVKEWAERIKNKSTGAMDYYTLTIYNEVYKEVTQ